MKTWLLYFHLIFFVSGIVGGRLFIENPNGTTISKFPNGDDSLETVILQSSVDIDGVPINTFSVGYNGGILSSPLAFPYPSWSDIPIRSIVAYWTDSTFLPTCSDCYIEIVTDIDDSVLGPLRTHFNIHAERTKTFVVTWKNAQAHRSQSLKNTFQVVIAGESNGNAYAIISYDTLEYGNTVTGITTKIGIKFTNQHRVILPGSSTTEAQQLTCRSNINIPGVFVFGLNSNSRYWFIPNTVENPTEFFVKSTCSHCVGEVTYDQPCTADYNPVCGSDNKTYSNECALSNAACRTSGSTSLLHNGACYHDTTTKRPTTTTTTPTTTTTTPTTTTTTPTTTTSTSTTITTTFTTTTTTSTTTTKKPTTTTTTPKTTTTTPTTTTTTRTTTTATPWTTTILPTTTTRTPTTTTTIPTTTTTTPTATTTTPTTTTSGMTTVVTTTRPKVVNCSLSATGCEDKCMVDSEGKHVCACNYGLLGPDNRTCNYDGSIYFGTVDGRIQLIFNETHSKHIEGFLKGRVIDTDHDHKRKNLFYADVLSDVGSDIGYVNLIDGIKRIIFNVSFRLIEGISYDSVNEAVYFTDVGSFGGRLSVIRNVYTNPSHTVLVSGLVNPRGVVYDECNGIVYFTDWKQQKLISYNVTSQQQKVILENVEAMYLSLDRQVGKIYFTMNRRIYSINFDGTCLEVVTVIYELFPVGLTTTPSDFIYSTDWLNHTVNLNYAIWRTNRYTGQNVMFKELTIQGQSIGYFYDGENCSVQPSPVCPLKRSPTGKVCFEYGAAAGDSLAPPGDDIQNVEVLIEKKGGIPMFSTKKDKLFININGLISFNQADSRTKVSIPDLSNKMFIAAFSKDLVTVDSGKTYFRQVSKPDSLKVISDKMEKLGVKGVGINYAIIITYEHVITYSYFYQLHTFQFTIASDETNSYGIWCFGNLDTTDAIIGYYGDGCHYSVLKSATPDSEQIALLTENKCTTTKSPMSTAKPPTTTPTTKPTTTNKPSSYDPYIVYQNSGLFNFTDAGSHGYILTAWNGFKPAVVLAEMISGLSINFVYPSVMTKLSENVLKGSVNYLAMLADKNVNNLSINLMALHEKLELSSSMVYGRFEFPIYSYGGQYCVLHAFPRLLSAQPVVIVNAELGIVYSSQYVSLWVKEASAKSMTVCIQELYSFSGPKVNISITYFAVAPVGFPSQSINQAATPNEVGWLKYPAKLFPNQEGYPENRRYCENLNFHYLYKTPPHVFVTPENGQASQSHIGGQLVAWVNEVTRSHAVVCAKNQNDYYSGRVADINVNYMVKGQLDVCSTYKACPSQLECAVNTVGQPVCGCKTSCPLSQLHDMICGNDYVTYESECHMQMESCKLYGTEKMSIIKMAYKGRCQTQPYSNGHVVLRRQGLSNLYCEDVSFQSGKFHPEIDVYVFVSVDVQKIENSTIYNAVAAYTTNVRPQGFTVCAMVAGRHYLMAMTIQPPVIQWIAYQNGIVKADPGSMAVGVVEMPTWYSGSRCMEIYFKDADKKPAVIVSVEDTKPNRFTNAMTAWVERYSMTEGRIHHRVCARELQNFDGKHEGVRIHWTVFYRPVIKHVTEIGEVVFKDITPEEDKPPIFCQKRYVRGVYPYLAHPTFIITPTEEYAPITPPGHYSNRDFVAWIQDNDGTYLNVCVKSLHTAQKGGDIRVSFSLLPKLCGKGSYFNGDKCFQLTTQPMNFDEAKAYCNDQLNSSLAILNEPSYGYFAEHLFRADTWIGLSDSEKEGSWLWINNEDASKDARWLPGQPSTGPAVEKEDCAALSRNGSMVGWRSEDCSTKLHALCVKDFKVELQPKCTLDCMNGGKCLYSTIGSFCECPSTHVGKQCEKEVNASDECTKYTVHSDPHRVFYRSPMPPVTLQTCDRDLVNATGWHRFTGTGGDRLLENKCTNGTNYCGVKYPGWLQGDHPKVEDGVKKMEIKFFFDYCASQHGVVNVRNCGNFFIYQFLEFPYWNCDYGLCTEN